MRFTFTALVVATFFTSPTLATMEEHGILKDDTTFWNRLLTNKYDVASTPPPTPRPTTAPPTPPSGPCDVSVDLTCVLTDDPESDCKTIEKVTQLECKGCPPIALCFSYTGAKCPDPLPPSMLSCSDFTDGPQAMADIIISNGNDVFFDATVEIGEEVCISNSMSPLPSELMIFINAPMGGDTPENKQLSTIDSSCSGPQQGLTLLRKYGAVDLVHFINDCQGNNDCFADVTYTYVAKNDGPIGLTITQLERTLNGVSLNLIEGVSPDELRLEPTEMYMATDQTVVDCCTDVTYNIEALVVSVGDDGEICRDTAMYELAKPVETPPPSASTPPPTPTPPTPPPTLPPTPTPPTPPPTLPPTPTPPTPPPTLPPTPTPPTPPPTLPPTPTPPTPPPTLPPTPIPPTPPPTLPPTPTPPTPPPTTLPPTPPPTDRCTTQVTVDCTPPLPPPGQNPFDTCDDIIGFRAECFEKPFSMGFRYNGGDCSQEFNEQDPQIYQCEDYNGSPPVNAGDQSYIVVTDIKGIGTDFFSGFVPVGGLVAIANPNPNLQLDANVNVTIYSSDNLAPENILQTMVIHTSCSQVTFLKDRYGALELLWFNNTVQGNVTCAVDLTFNYNVLNSATGFNVVVESLTSVTNFVGNEFINFTDQVAGQVLNPGQSLDFDLNITIDTSIRQLYTTFTTIQGRPVNMVDGEACRDLVFFNFTAGNTNTAPFFFQQPSITPATAPV